jgi:hypothetical protein
MQDYERQWRDNFAAQFEKRDGVILYRRNQTSAPIPVSAQERDGFIRDFSTSMNGLYGKFTAELMLTLGSCVLISVFARGLGGVIEFMITAAHVIGLTIIVSRQSMALWNVPANALVHRAPYGEARGGWLHQLVGHFNLSWPKIWYGLLVGTFGTITMPFFYAAMLRTGGGPDRIIAELAILIFAGVLFLSFASAWVKLDAKEGD